MKNLENNTVRTYENATEIMVEQSVDKVMQGLGACTCKRCRTDVICIALNRLPPHYVSSYEGVLMTKLAALAPQMATDIMVQVTAAARIVKANPHHAAETS